MKPKFHVKRASQLMAAQMAERELKPLPVKRLGKTRVAKMMTNLKRASRVK